MEDFTRVRVDNSIPRADLHTENVEQLNVEHTIVAYENYLGIEIGLPRGNDDNLISA